MSYRGVIPHMFAEQARQKARRLRGAKALGIGTAVPLAAYGGARAAGFTNEQIASAIGAGAKKVLPENFYYPNENAEHSYFFGSRSVEKKSPYRNGQKPAGDPFPQFLPNDYWFLEPFAGPRMMYNTFYKDKQKTSTTNTLVKGSAAKYDNVTAQMNGDLSAARARRLASSLFARNHKESSGKGVKKRLTSSLF